MFYEELTCIKFDLAKLQQDVKTHVFPLGKQVIQGEEYETPAYHGFGGWSVTSRTGDWRDGWDFFQNDHGEAMEIYFPQNDNNFKSLKFFDIAHSMEHKNPTQACVGELAYVVNQLEDLGLYPRRVRITCLKAGAITAETSLENQEKIYKYGEKCYTYTTAHTKCDKTKQIIDIQAPLTEEEQAAKQNDIRSILLKGSAPAPAPAGGTSSTTGFTFLDNMFKK